MIHLSRRALIQLSCAALAFGADQDPTWRARVVDDKEKGEPLIVRGRVLRTPGGAPAPGTTIMVYQTDARGIYKEGERVPPIKGARLRGTFVSGPRGEYEIVTVKPGAYPDGTAPLHIHVNLVESGQEPREVCEFFFAGDPLLKGGEKGYVLQPRKDAKGVLIAMQDFALEK